MSKVILVLSDGLRYDTAVAGMGTLGHLVEARLASLYKVLGEIPSISRPTYESIHTGLPVSEHGIISNKVVRKSTKSNIFQLAHDIGKSTAAAAYYWVSELYNHAPYQPVEDREVDDDTLPIQHGRFYMQDDFPDSELFNTATMLVRIYAPDYLLVHPMGMDHTGETYGANSVEYRRHATHQDLWLAPHLFEWMGLGYCLLITGDHGITDDGFHGGTTSAVREVPLYLVQPGLTGGGDTRQTISQLQIAPTICKILGIPIPDTMKAAPLI